MKAMRRAASAAPHLQAAEDERVDADKRRPMTGSVRADQPRYVRDLAVVMEGGSAGPGHAAKGSIGDAGGTADTLAISATALAAEDSRPGTTGDLVYGSGFAAAVG